jgi:DNA-binding transcriptional LysR family regulator
MKHNIRWNDLQFILAVAECGSLSAAGRLLGVRHSTVLRRISAFEDKIGCRLFERGATGYVMTSDSRDVLSALRSIENSIFGLERSLSTIGTPFAGRVRVTSTDTICQTILPPHIKALNETYPQLEVELLSTNNRLDLAQLDAEITIRPSQALQEGLIGERICDLCFQVYGSPVYLDSHQSRFVAGHRWLGVADPTSRSPVGSWEADTIAQYVVFRSDSFATLCHAAEQGLGLAMLPSFLGNDSGKLVIAEHFPQILTTGLWLACHNKLSGSDRINSLVGYFSRALHMERHRLSGRIRPAS